MVASNYSIMVNKGSDKKSILPVYHDDEIEYETKKNRFDSDSEAEEEEFGYDSGVPSMLKHGINALVGSDVPVQGEGSVFWALLLLFLSFVSVIIGGLFVANTLVTALHQYWASMFGTITIESFSWGLKLAAVGGSALLWIAGYFYTSKYFGGSTSFKTQFLAYSYTFSLLPLGGCGIATLCGKGIPMDP